MWVPQRPGLSGGQRDPLRAYGYSAHLAHQTAQVDRTLRDLPSATDDVRSYPYLTYDNVLVWKALRALSSLYPETYGDLAGERRSSAGRSWSTVLSRARTAHTMPGPRIWRAIQMYMTSRQEACCSCPTWASARRMTPHIRIQCVRSAPRSILTASPGAPLRKSAAPTPPIPGC